jgi:streptogramin lyase
MSGRVALVAALLGALTRAAAAAPPVRVSLARPVPAATVGRAWNPKLAVRPASFRGSLRVTATGPRRLTAAASRTVGSYRARFVFPEAGRWTLTARAGGSTSRLGSLDVRPAAPTPLLFSEPTSIDLEPSGTLLVVENNPGRLLRVDPATGSVEVLAPALVRPFAVARAPSGAIYVSGGTVVRRISGTGAPETVTELDTDTGPVAIGANGDVYFATATRVFRLAGGAGTPVRLAGTGAQGGAGDGGPAADAQFAAPHGIALAADGALLVADTGNDRVRRIDPATGVITAFAQVGIPDGMDVAPDGTIYVVEARSSRVVHLTATGTRLRLVGPSFQTPYDVEVAPDGVVYVLEAGPAGRIKRVAPDGTVTTVSRG